MVDLLATVVLAGFTELLRRVLAWIDTRKSLAQRDLLHRLAEEAFAYVEQTMVGAKSADKLGAASIYLARALEARGIHVGPDEIRAAIEKAVLQHNQRKIGTAVKS